LSQYSPYSQYDSLLPCAVQVVNEASDSSDPRELLLASITQADTLTHVVNKRITAEHVQRQPSEDSASSKHSKLLNGLPSNFLKNFFIKLSVVIRSPCRSDSCNCISLSEYTHNSTSYEQISMNFFEELGYVADGSELNFYIDLD